MPAPRRRNGFRRVAPLLLALLLAGCASAEAPPPDSFYRLELEDPGRRYGTPLLEGTLEVARFDADGLLAQRPVIFRTAGPALRQYNYHYWAEAPALMLQDAFVAALRTAGVAARVVTPELRQIPDYRLVGKVKRLQYEPEARPPVVKVALELGLLRDRDGRLLLLETYRGEQRTDQSTVASAVTAFQAALTDLAARFLDDLAEAARRDATAS